MRTLMAAPFSPGEFRKHDADWHRPHKQSKKRGWQTDRSTFQHQTGQERLCFLWAQGVPQKVIPYLHGILLRRATCQSKRTWQKEVVGLTAVGWSWVRANLLLSLLRKRRSQIALGTGKRQGAKEPTGTPHNAASFCQ